MALKNRLGILLNFNLGHQALGPHKCGMLNVVHRKLHARETILIAVEAAGKVLEKFREAFVVVLDVINKREEVVRHLAHAFTEGATRKLVGG